METKSRIKTEQFARRNQFQFFHRNNSAAIVSSNAWGRLPELSLLGTVGLLIVAIADTVARKSSLWAEPLFWIGLLVLFVPMTIRIVMLNVSRQERIGLLIILGLGLYFAKVLQSPVTFTGHDELLHWKTADDIQRTNHLFQENSLLPISPLYPGLEIITNALSALSGLSLFASGIVIIGAARLVLILSLYLLFEQISKSAWLAGVAALLYMTNQHFLFFGGMYAYESLALPLAVFILFTIVDGRKGNPDHVGRNFAAIIGLGAVVITHHLTSFALIAFLALWAITPFLYHLSTHIVDWYSGNKSFKDFIQGFRKKLSSPRQDLDDGADPEKHLSPGLFALIGLGLSFAWIVIVGNLVVDYLSPIFGSAINELIKLIAGEATTRVLFFDYGGGSAPIWERIISLSSVGLSLLGLPFGLYWIWRNHRSNLIDIAMAITTLLYPVTLALRLTRLGSDVSDRSAEFLFEAVAFVLACGIVLLWSTNFRKKIRFGALILLITIMFVGGIIAGSGRSWARLPGPYLVSADMRSMDAQGISTAEWVKNFLGPNNRIATDRDNRLLLGAYGTQYSVTNLADKVDVSPLFFSPEFGIAERNIIQDGKIQYLVVDHRLTTGLPRVGIYFEEGEPNGYNHKIPIDLAALEKFDKVNQVSRLFDNGDIIIYKMEGLVNEP